MIRKLESDAQLPMDLLLLADPSVESIRNYMDRAVFFVLENNDQIKGICAVIQTRPLTLEIVNISVQEEDQGKGYGKILIAYVVDYAKNQQYKSIELGTGNSSISQIAFYQKCGFSISGIDKDFFIIHYPEPIFENGIQCKDMIRFSKIL